MAGSAAAAMVGSFGLAGSRPLLYLASRERTEELLAYSEVRLAANEVLTKASEACHTLLRKHQDALQAVSEVLLVKGRIGGAEVARLLAEYGRAVDRDARTLPPSSLR
ncbi:hypothetical protein FNL55_07605 [Tardiphaga sp. vice352]|uniref:hypothetical protein n=1 Tax=Tardiphaga sp. vice352 TaxID=2592816 RepID=UPI001164EFF1|nr:hypothetical protein [Tardiphaga sp. vice352]QDM31175.1 hypothetical protein FNL55_07605 [Tardiphaga sp. vice352]